MLTLLKFCCSLQCRKSMATGPHCQKAGSTPCGYIVHVLCIPWFVGKLRIKYIMAPSDLIRVIRAFPPFTGVVTCRYSVDVDEVALT